MVSDYVNFIVEKGSKFDKLDLIIFSIATKCLIGVIHRDNSMCTTNESGDMEECEALLLNRGNLMFESVEMIEVENEDDEAGNTVAEKKDPTYYPEDEEEDYKGGGDGDDDDEGDEEDEEDEEEEEGGEKEGDEEVEGGEKVSLAIAVVPPIQRETSKKERVVVEFSSLTRSVRKRQQEEMMRDVESQIDSNKNKGEVMETPSAPVTGAAVTTEP